MKLNITDLRNNKGNFVPYYFTEKLERLIGKGYGDSVIKIKLEAGYFSKKILIKGSMKTDILFQCSRCLTTFSSTQRVFFNEEFEQFEEESVNQHVEYYLSEAEETAACYYFRGDVLKLSDFFRQTLLISLPWKPLCHEKCRGLCPECGINLNMNSCQCSREEIDPRWAVLKDLINK